jgi:hypothetical protein
MIRPVTTRMVIESRFVTVSDMVRPALGLRVGPTRRFGQRSSPLEVRVELHRGTATEALSAVREDDQ